MFAAVPNCVVLKRTNTVQLKPRGIFSRRVHKLYFKLAFSQDSSFSHLSCVKFFGPILTYFLPPFAALFGSGCNTRLGCSLFPRSFGRRVAGEYTCPTALPHLRVPPNNFWFILPPPDVFEINNITLTIWNTNSLPKKLWYWTAIFCFQIPKKVVVSSQGRGMHGDHSRSPGSLRKARTSASLYPSTYRYLPKKMVTDWKP